MESGNAPRIDFNQFITLHDVQLRSSGIPGHFWKQLHEKLLDETYDAHLGLSLNCVEYANDVENTLEWKVVVNRDELKCTAPTSIYLIDHAWTFDISSMRISLSEVPKLRERMADLMDLSIADTTESDAIAGICKYAWRFCRHYKVTTLASMDHVQSLPELQQLRWYVLDEVGSRIPHSDEPTARMVPFFYIPRNVCYSLLWPTKDLEAGDEITVDYIEDIKDASLRPYYLMPWQPQDFSDEPIEHTFVFTDEFFQSHCMEMTQPRYCDQQTNPTELAKPLRVYSDLQLVGTYVTDQRFSLVESPDEAHILWYRKHFNDFEKLGHAEKGQQWVNQFPGEQVICVKDLLAAVVGLWQVDRPVTEKHTASDYLDDIFDNSHMTAWYPLTFNLVYELPQFVAYYQRKQAYLDKLDEVENPLCSLATCPCQQELPGCHSTTTTNGYSGTSRQACARRSKQQRNLWILKPWNLGRGYGITISDQLEQIVCFSRTGPLIASRYVTDPVLFYREDVQANVKFDIRYVVLMQSVSPLRIFVYKVFWLRFANKPFILGNYDDYATHFTVMNYRDDEVLKQIHSEEFVQLFDHQYPNTSWPKVQDKIFAALVDLFTAATSHQAPKGITACPQSRAMYAVDLMLEWVPDDSTGGSHQISPVVCEVNFCPDCNRACQYHPDFFNHVFSCLFLDESVDKCNVIKLC